MSGMSQEQLAFCSQVSLCLKKKGGGGCTYIRCTPSRSATACRCKGTIIGQVVRKGLAQGGKEATDTNLRLRVYSIQR